MTDPDQKLCRDIAEAEEWEHVCGKNGWWGWSLPGSDVLHDRIPDYLTGPAETVRMLETLLDYKWTPVKIDGRYFFLDVEDKWIRGLSDIGYESLALAVAQAFLAMLLEEKGK